MYENIW
jgi:hypothetical protein